MRAKLRFVNLPNIIRDYLWTNELVKRLKMKQIILIIVSVIVFLGCEADKKRGANVGEENSTANVGDDMVTNRSSAVREATTGEILKLVTVPVIKNGPCPAGYFSPRNKYCVPTEGAPAIIPKQRGFSCPSDWFTQSEYCVASPNAAVNISQISACPAGWSANQRYCVAESNASALISRIRGYPCPPGWSPEHSYCVAGHDSPSVVHKRKDYPCPLGWSEQNEYCLK